MRTVSAEHTAAWKSGEYTGLRRAMQRATLQVLGFSTTSYGPDIFAQYLFAQPWVPVELPNIRSINYDRHVDTDAATCEIQLYNTQPLPLGTAVQPDDYGNYIFDQPGYFTFNRGMTTYTNRWHHTTNEWQRLLAPDRIIRTYEGYGFDATVGPDFDSHMNQSGVWIIDDVVYNDNGTITVSCRDGGRLLIDQMIHPPVVPKNRYPMSWTSEYDAPNTGGIDPASVFFTPTYETDSSSVHGGPDLNEFGHQAHHLFDDNAGTYWLSVGYPDSDNPAAAEWVQGTFESQTIKGVSITSRGGPYVVYVSLWTTYNPPNPTSPVAARWGGGANIPYGGSTSPNAAGIRYLHSVVVPANSTAYLGMGDSILGCTKVRFTFRHLYNSRQADPGFPRNTYRAAAVAARVSGPTFNILPSTGTHKEGDYNDYTQIVKRLLAYGGFHWPNDPALAFVTATDGSRVAVMPPSDDAFLESGRIWGDLMDTGTSGIPNSTLDATVWDKKSLMDGIAYVRDVVGFNFFIDETGAAVWRSPNVWQVGCYVGDAGTGPAYVSGAENLVVIDENETLMSLSVKLTSRNFRERVFISNTNGQFGATAAGHLGDQGPFDSRMRRLGGWTDQNFNSNEECRIMADLIALRQLFSYRTDQLQIPGYSAIQIDDQVRVIEGTTSEDFIHYVRGLSSAWDIETGVWTYSLETHWLGEDPFTDWAFQVTDLSLETQAYLAAQGTG